MKKRNTAYKLWLSQLASSKYVKQNVEFESSYIDLEGKKISRVNIIATVISKFVSEDGNYIALVLDDSSSQIRIKAWGEDCNAIKSIEPGMLVLSIGKVKEYNNELYIIPEIVKPLEDLNWEIARKLELLKEYGFVKAAEANFNVVEENKDNKESYREEKIENNVSNDARNIVLNIINKINGNDGASINEITRLSGFGQEETNAIIDELVRDGEIYKSRVGVVNLV